ncbi:MAG: PIN domain-containing protein, partial [Patescibacteria group bacterium]
MTIPKTFRYMLVDGNALIHRGYHAIPVLNTKNGEQTNAVYGFTMILLKAIKDIKPTHIVCTFDLAGPTFRHEQYKEYKGTRVKADQELYDQIPRVKEVARALNIPIVEKQGFEADDCLGTLAVTIHKADPEAEVI